MGANPPKCLSRCVDDDCSHIIFCQSFFALLYHTTSLLNIPLYSPDFQETGRLWCPRSTLSFWRIHGGDCCVATQIASSLRPLHYILTRLGFAHLMTLHVIFIISRILFPIISHFQRCLVSVFEQCVRLYICLLVSFFLFLPFSSIFLHVCLLSFPSPLTVKDAVIMRITFTNNTSFFSRVLAPECPYQSISRPCENPSKQSFGVIRMLCMQCAAK